MKLTLLTISSVLPILVKAQLPGGWDALGCYTDTASSRTLSASAYTNVAGMTPQACVQFCSAGGFKYAGVEYARECYCDNLIHPPGAFATNPGSCNMACSGDPSQTCGGPDRLFIYTAGTSSTTTSTTSTSSTTTSTSSTTTTSSSTTSNAATSGTATSSNTTPSGGTTTTTGGTTPSTATSSTSSVAPIATPMIKKNVGTWTYKGCRVDFSPRSLSTRLNIPGNANSAEYCTAQCKLQGYSLAGLEYGSECWCDNYMPYGQLVDDSQCSMVCSGDSTELCGAGSRLALYQDTSATHPNANVCITGRDSFSFGNTGIQFIPRSGSTNTVNGTGVQMFANTLDPSTDGPNQHTVIRNCKTCVYSSNEAPLYNFQLYQNSLTPYGLFGNPIPLQPQAGEPITFLGFSTSTAFAQFCAKPNPVSPEGPFIGFPLLSVGGYTDRFSVCPNTTANNILTVIYSPVANHADYTLSSCQDVYLILTPSYARTDLSA